MIFGYPTREVNEHGLLELREVTFKESAEDLRTIAQFLSRMADAMDAGEFEKSSHQHLSVAAKGWRKAHGYDVIVTSVERKNPPPVVGG